MNTFNPIAEKLSFTPEMDLLQSFRWEDFGVSGKYLIVFTGRNGSTLLTKLVQHTGLCGAPEEYFSEGFISYQLDAFSPITPQNYLSYLAKRFARNGVFGAEIDPMRLRWLEAVMNVGGGVFDAATTPHVWMTRSDIVSQAYSYAVAKVSGLWHVAEDGKEITTTPHVARSTVTDNMIWNNLIEIIRNEQYAENYFASNGIAPLRITYEDLVSEKFLTLLRILRHIKVELPIDIQSLAQSTDPMKKMSYSSKYEEIIKFESRHRENLEHIIRNRKNIDLKSFIWE